MESIPVAESSVQPTGEDTNQIPTNLSKPVNSSVTVKQDDAPLIPINVTKPVNINELAKSEDTIQISTIE